MTVFGVDWLLAVIVAVMLCGFLLWLSHWWHPRAWRDAEARGTLGTGLLTGAGISLAFFLLQNQNQDNREKVADRQALRVRVGIEQDLSKTDLRKSDLSGVDLGSKVFSDADLRDSDLRGASLRKAELSARRWKGEDLQGATLEGADLRGADLTEAKLNEAFLNGVDLRGASLEDASLNGAAIGTGPDGNPANLSGAWMVDAHLIGACLASADLRGAVLGGADLRRAVLTGADLRGAIFERDGIPANLAGAWVANVKIDPADQHFLPDSSPVLTEPNLSSEVPVDAIADHLKSVSDGDTVELEKLGWVRLVGLDARDLDDPAGLAARDFLTDEMGRARAIRFKYGRTRREVRVTGIPGRWLAYIWLSDGRFLNEALLAEGYVEREKDRSREDPRYEEVLDEAEKRAKAGGKRVWAACAKQERR